MNVGYPMLASGLPLLDQSVIYNPLAHQQPQPQLACLVCGDTNAQNHYGTVCCPSCKGFFRRSYLSSKTLECYRGNACKITKTTRNNCRACRYNRCLAVGMNANEIRQKPSPGEPLVDKPQVIVIADSPTPQSSPPQSPPSHHLPVQQQTHDDPVKLAKFFANIERYVACSLVAEGVSPMEEEMLIRGMLDGSVQQLINRSATQCPRYPLCWKAERIVSGEELKRTWARAICYYLDWISHLPTFKNMSGQDKVTMFSGRATAVIILSMCVESARAGVKALLLGSGNLFPIDSSMLQLIKDQNVRRLFQAVSDSLLNDVIIPISHSGFTEEELALMKMSLFLFEAFTCSGLSEEGRETLLKERTRIKKALVNVIFTRNNSDHNNNLNKLIQMEQIYITVEAAAAHVDKEMGFLNLFGIADLKGSLIHELHVEKYNVAPPKKTDTPTVLGVPPSLSSMEAALALPSPPTAIQALPPSSSSLLSNFSLLSSSTSSSLSSFLPSTTSSSSSFSSSSSALSDFPLLP